MSMKKFHKAAVALAVAGALVAPAANAVNLAEDGLGDFIYSPIYNVRDGFRTYINVHNTSEETLVFKIRFREHYNSREVRDFNVTMSPFDVWTAQIFLNESTGAARLETPDHTCTSPIAIRDAVRIGGVDVNDFTNSAYAEDGGPAGIERTQMGYFEIINMGQDSENDYYFYDDNDTPIADWAEHVGPEGDRWPRNCPAIDGTQGWMSDGTPLSYAGNYGIDTWLVEAGLGWFTYFDEPENVLKVNVAMVNTETGVGFDVPVTTLANFFNPENYYSSYQDQWGSTNLIYNPGDLYPDASQAFPQLSNVHTNMAGLSLPSIWVNSGNDADTVSAVLMRANVINQYRSDGANADTDWVVTFPTKHFYTDIPDTGLQADAPDYLFPEMWGEVNDDESCVPVVYNYWSREEDTVVPDPEDLMPSPPPPTFHETFQLCREVNVIRFGNGVLHTADSATEDLYQYTPPFQAGWIRLDIAPADTDLLDTTAYDLIDDSGVVHEGLPIIGFASQEADNYWSYSWEHAYGRSLMYQTVAAGGPGPDGWVQGGNNPAFGADLATPSMINPYPLWMYDTIGDLQTVIDGILP